MKLDEHSYDRVHDETSDIPEKVLSEHDETTTKSSRIGHAMIAACRRRWNRLVCLGKHWHQQLGLAWTWMRSTLVGRMTLGYGLLLCATGAILLWALGHGIDYAEFKLVQLFMEEDLDDISDEVIHFKEITVPPYSTLYGNVLNTKSIPEQYRSLPDGLSRINGEVTQFVFRKKYAHDTDLILVRRTASFAELDRTIEGTIFATMIIIFGIALLLGIWLSYTIMAPIHRLTKAVKQAAQSQTYHPLPVEPGADEVGQLAKICDHALNSLHQALDREKAFTGAVSHELRTPLAVIDSSLEILRMRSDWPERAQVHLDKIHKSTRVMQELVRVFLNFARVADTPGTDSVSSILQSLYPVWKSAATQKNLQVELKFEEVCPGSFSPIILGSVIHNLVNNAITHTQIGSVTVVQTTEGFEVHDTGPGISESEQSKVFGRYYQTQPWDLFQALSEDETRQQPQSSGSSTKTNNVGLGLHIVHRLCSEMGWEVALQSELGVGTVFKVTLHTPKAQARLDEYAARRRKADTEGGYDVH